MAFINYNEPDAAAVFLTEFESRDRMIEPRFAIKTPQTKASRLVTFSKLNIHHREQTAQAARPFEWWAMSGLPTFLG